MLYLNCCSSSLNKQKHYRIYIVIPPNSNTFSTFDSHVIRSCTLKPRQICVPAGVKQINPYIICSIFELGGIRKQLMTGPTGNSEFCFPSTLKGNTVSLGNSLFPLGPVIKCSLYFIIGAGNRQLNPYTSL